MPPVPPPPPSSSSSRTTGRESLIDAGTVLAGCGGDPTLFGTMVQSFARHVQTRLDDVRDAVEQQDAVALQRAAHKLMGLVSAFSGEGARAAGVLEQMGSDGQTAGAADQYFRVAILVRRVAAALENLSIEELRRQASAAKSAAGKGH